MFLEGDHELVDFCPHTYFSGSLTENIDGLGLDVPILLEEADDLHRWLWLEVVQPVEELHKHSQGSLLASHPRNSVKEDPVHGVVEEECRAVFERSWDHVLRDVPKEGTRSMNEHEGNVIDQSFG